MKIIIGIILFFSLIQNCRTQVTDYSKFLPLKVGNTWVYSNSGWGSGKARISVTGTMIANGHVYFVLGFKGDSCSCAQGPFTPFLRALDPIRVDSSTGNVMQYGTSCQWQVGEHLLDSLAVRQLIIQYNSCNGTSCSDTSVQNWFGINVKTKFVGENIMTYYSLRRYAYGFGIVGSSKGCFYSSCGFNLLGCIIDGIAYGDTTMPVGITPISLLVPGSFSLYQNYPNPFNPSTKIKFDIPPLSFGEGNAPEARGVRLSIYNSLGQEVAVLVNEELQPGTYEVEWNAADMPSGAYFYKLIAGEFSETKKMVLIK